jgi:D-serine dehydratase
MDQDFDEDPSEPLPDPEVFDFPEPMLARICALMTRNLKRLKKADEDIEDADTRRYAFTDALRKVTVEQFKEDGYAEKDFNAIAEMDNQVYDGKLKWSAITGEGKELETAAAITRAG